MHDPLDTARKFRKRKRKLTGSSFADTQQGRIDELEEAQRRGRVHCRGCHKYKPWSALEMQIRRLKKNWFERLWVCMDCGTAVLMTEIDLRKKKKKDRTLP